MSDTNQNEALAFVPLLLLAVVVAVAGLVAAAAVAWMSGVVS